LSGSTPKLPVAASTAPANAKPIACNIIRPGTSMTF
jgi:hypothetical protein